MAEPERDPPLRVQVENLGRIASADVELRPMTVFVGENNSGKSYLATLVWGLCAMSDQQIVSPGHPAWTEALEHARGLASVRQESPQGADGAQVWSSLADRLWPALSQRLLSFAFNAPMSATVRLARTGGGWFEGRFDGSTEVTIGQPDRGPVRETARLLPPDVPTPINRLHQTPTWSRDAIRHDLEEYKLKAQTAAGVREALGLLSAPRGVAMLPASRSGYIHMLPAFVDQLVAGLGPVGRANDLELPAPTVEFLRAMVRRPERARGDIEHPDLAEMLEAGALGGIWHSGPGEMGKFLFQPAQSDVFLPTTRVSSVATELLPLLRVLLNKTPSVLIYEEPEAHLHPRLQRLVAQVLTRLVRRGTKVLITTHSVDLCQQLNNFLKRSHLDPDARERVNRELGTDYTDEDVLNEDEIAAYDFRFREDGRTVVERREVDERGMILPSFNEELDRLGREVRALNDALDGE